MSGNPDGIRKLEADVCAKLGIPSDGWRVQFRHVTERGDKWQYCKEDSEEHAQEEAFRRVVNGWVTGAIYESFPWLATDPAAFDLVAEALGEQDITVSIDFGFGIARIDCDSPGNNNWHTGETWREAVCRAVLGLGVPAVRDH